MNISVFARFFSLPTSSCSVTYYAFTFNIRFWEIQLQSAISDLSHPHPFTSVVLLCQKMPCDMIGGTTSLTMYPTELNGSGPCELSLSQIM